jgi:hypothetical protein
VNVALEVERAAEATEIPADKVRALQAHAQRTKTWAMLCNALDPLDCNGTNSGGTDPALELRFCDELDFGFGWIAAEPAYMLRASHALAHDSDVWLIDPVDGRGVDERVRALGRPVGVIQLLDRHERDCAALAERHGVPLHRTPFDGVPGSPFQLLRVIRNPLWNEVALWWAERRVLVVAEALGTARYFLAPGDELGVHPLLRMLPPRSLSRLEPEHILCGHGEGVHGPAAAVALRRAITGSRRRTPAWLAGLVTRR